MFQEFVAKKFYGGVWKIAIVSLLFAVLLSSCDGERVVATPIPEPYPRITEIPKDLTGWTEIKLEDPSATVPKFVYSDGLDRSITINQVPAGVTPYLVPITDKNKELLSSYYRPVECLTVVGDLAFFNDETGKLESKFDPPVVITYNWTEDDSASLSDCFASLAPSQEFTPDKLVPLFLYIPSDDTTINVWKTIAVFEFNSDMTALTITVESWGGDPFGFGGPKK